MSDTTTPRATPRKRGEGQWGLGYHEPLNTAEQIKKDDDGLNVRERIDRIFAPGGFRSIGKQDLRSRMRWYGLYTQRKQGVPGERTGSAEPEELEDEFFMMRIRIDGGRMTSEQLRAIAWASERFGRDVADVTDRQNVQLHWIRIEDVPAIFERIEAVGLTTQEACGDTPRVFLGCPLAGVTADEVLDATADVRAVASRYVGDPAFSNLPRKYKTSISGCRVHCTNPEINDISLVGVDHPTLGPGYDLQVGGGLSTNPMFAQRLGAFVEPARVPGRVGRRDRALPRVRLPPLAEPRAAEVPGEGLGTPSACARSWSGSSWMMWRCPTARLPRRDRWPIATTSACTSSGTGACSSASRRGQDASRDTSCDSWPTSRTRSATGSWPRPRSRSW